MYVYPLRGLGFGIVENFLRENFLASGGSCSDGSVLFRKVHQNRTLGKYQTALGQVLRGHSVTRERQPTSRGAQRAVTGPSDSATGRASVYTGAQARLWPRGSAGGVAPQPMAVRGGCAANGRTWGTSYGRAQPMAAGGGRGGLRRPLRAGRSLCDAQS